MDTPLSRRRLIEAGGVGAAMSFAGCNSFGSQEPQGSEGDGGQGDGSGGSTTTVTVFADVDQEEMQSFQQDLQQQLQSGEISRQEAQTQARQKQSELLSTSVESIEERVANNDDLSVSEAMPEAGVLLVEGSASAVVGTLGYTEVHGLLEASEFDRLQSQSQGASPGGSGQPGSADGSGDRNETDGSGGSGNTNSTADSA